MNSNKTLSKDIFIYEAELIDKKLFDYSNQYIIFGSTNARLTFFIDNKGLLDYLDYELLKTEVYNFLKSFDDLWMNTPEETIKAFLNGEVGEEKSIDTILNIDYPSFSYMYRFDYLFGFCVACNMSKLLNEEFVKEYFDNDNYKITKYNFDNIEDMVDKKDVIKSLGAFCRSCKEFNHYGEIDNVIDDGKYTCWNCANSSHRIYNGLLYCDNLESAVKMIKANNNIRS